MRHFGDSPADRLRRFGWDGFPGGDELFRGFGRGFGRGHGHGHDEGPDHGRGGFRGRGGRGRRPNVRAAVLALLLERPMHGYEMIQELESRTGGMWRPSPGSVYPTLQLLADEGLISSAEEGGRRQFQLTDEGRAEAERAEGRAPWDEFDNDEMAQARDFREASMGVLAALRQVGVNGTDEQRTQALDVLRETRRRLYAILAEMD